MPRASEEQVPKPLTYTLMYHFLWCVMFLLSAALLWSIFLASGQRSASAILAPLAVVAFALLAGVGALGAYELRVRLLLNEVTREEAFRWSAFSSRVVIVFAAAVLAAWALVLAPLARSLWGGGQPWPVPVLMTEALLQVELVVWGLSHLMSVRGISRGRKKYLTDSAAPAVAPPAAARPEPELVADASR
jgi:hypothetical protein